MSRCFAAPLSRRAALVLAGATTAGLARPVAAQGRFPEHPIRMLLPFTPGGPTDVQMRTLCDLAAKRLGRAVVDRAPDRSRRYPRCADPGCQRAARRLHAGADADHGVARAADRPRALPSIRSRTSPGSFSSPATCLGWWCARTRRGRASAICWTMRKRTRARSSTAHRARRLRPTLSWSRSPLGMASPGFRCPTAAPARTWRHCLPVGSDAAADASGWAPQVQEGRLRLLCTWGAARARRFPDAPTLREVGFDIVATSPYGIAGPKGMAAGVVQVLHDAFKDALNDPAHVAVLDRFDMQIAYLDSEDYATAVRRQYEEEREMVRRLGLRPS